MELWNTTEGDFFLTWYSDRLIRHGDIKVLKYLLKRFVPSQRAAYLKWARGRKG